MAQTARFESVVEVRMSIHPNSLTSVNHFLASLNGVRGLELEILPSSIVTAYGHVLYDELQEAIRLIFKGGGYISFQVIMNL